MSWKQEFLSWEAGTLRVYKQREALQLDLS